MRFTPFIICDVETVDVQLHLVCGGGEGTISGCIRRGEIFHGVVEREVLYDRTRGEILLNLGDEEVVFTSGDITPFFIIEIEVVGVLSYLFAFRFFFGCVVK